MTAVPELPPLPAPLLLPAPLPEPPLLLLPPLLPLLLPAPLLPAPLLLPPLLLLPLPGGLELVELEHAAAQTRAVPERMATDTGISLLVMNVHLSVKYESLTSNPRAPRRVVARDGGGENVLLTRGKTIPLLFCRRAP